MKTFKDNSLAGIMLFLLLSQSLIGYGQKGFAPADTFSAVIHSNYPAHLDFKESMLFDLKVPEGFTVSIVAMGLGKPRIMAIGKNGSLYITRRDVGDVLLLSDKDASGRFTSLRTVWTSFPDVHGITAYEGYLFLASSKVLKRAKILENGDLADTITLANDFPDGGQHDNRMIAFGPDGRLYMTIGSDCNDCAETNKENATLVVMDANGHNRKIFARGLRNTIGFDWQPEKQEIWGCDNGEDWRGDDLPPEELNKIVEDGDYGWPQVFGKQQVDPTREDPPGGTKAAYAKTTVPAVLLFPAHSAPIDFRFLNGPARFPAEYKNDALVAWHGSWNRKEPQGYKVQRIHFEKGEAVSATDFLWGFLSPDGKTRFGRPAGIMVSPDGAVYISDDENGVIYSVTHK